jgi:GTP cyclohydrolase I
MEGIRVPLRFCIEPLNESSISLALNAQVSAYVSLDLSESRGIHMSRLYLSVQKLSEKAAMNFGDLESVLQEFLDHHQALSQSARLVVEIQLPLLRPSLKSQISSWKTYPFKIELEKARDFDGLQTAKIHFCVEYSSTCPASTALAREAYRDSFRAHFQGKKDLSSVEVEAFLSSPESSFATPHAQRSLATVSLSFKSLCNLSFSDLVRKIDGVEGVLKTPVQGAVKRVDEMEFAKLNGKNTMFCEDAARRIAAYFQSQSESPSDNEVEDYSVKVEHFESLHSHNAVAFARKIRD